MMDHPTNWSPYFRDDNFGQDYDLGGCQGHQGFQDQQYNNYSKLTMKDGGIILTMTIREIIKK